MGNTNFLYVGELKPLTLILRTVIFAPCYPQIGYLIGHYTTDFLPFEVEMPIFFVADMCAKYREKRRNEGFLHVF